MKKARACIGILLLLFAARIVYAGEDVVVVAIKSHNTYASSPYTRTLEAFKAELKKQGIRSHLIEFNLERKKKEEFPEIYQEVASSEASLIFALGTPAAKTTQQTIKHIPTIFVMVLDPERSNIMPPGVSMSISFETKLRELKRILSGVKKIGFVYSPAYRSLYGRALKACRKLDLELIGREVGSQKEFPQALEYISSEKIDCFLMSTDPKIYFTKSVEHLLTEGLQKGFPVIGLSSSYTRAGALVSFECDYEDLGKQGAELALRVLGGEDIAKLGSEEPRKIKYSLNLHTAKRLGIKIPEQIKKEASEVIGR